MSPDGGSVPERRPVRVHRPTAIGLAALVLVLCVAAGGGVELERVASAPFCRDLLARGRGFDLDHDAAREFILRRGSPSSRLEFYESTGNNAFALAQSLATISSFSMPRDAGDADGDGLSDLVVTGQTNNVRHLRIYESTTQSGYPTSTTPVWEAPGWGGLISGGQIADTDRDGKQEITFGGLAPSFVEYGVTVFENSGNNTYAQTYNLPLPEEPQSLLVMSDLDGDGRSEIVHTNPGDVYLVEATGDNMYQDVASLRLVHTDGQIVNTTVLEYGGDLDGDGRKEFLVGGLKTISAGSDPFINVLYLFEAVGNDTYVVATTFTRPVNLESPITATIGDVDGDGNGEIVIANQVGVSVYKNTGDDAWKEIWLGTGIHVTNYATDAGDHDGDGKEEILFRETDGTTGIFEIDPADAVDGDGDGFVDAIDNCPELANGGQEDADADGAGDACDNCLHVANPSQGPAVLGQTILARDMTTFVWSVPVEVVYVRGELGGVGSYPVELVQTLPPGSSLTDATQPVAGTGFYYLVRPDCPVGSWQSTVGAEPGRDLALP